MSETNDKKKETNDNTETSSIAVDKAGQKHIEWSDENENILVEWCDVAQCYKWLNARSHTNYSYMHAWFTIPAITLSTVSGTASFAQASLPVAYQTYAPMVIGSINIFIGILTTVQQYLKISELNEAHRVSSISWDKFARNIRIELSKAPNERMDAGQFIKLCRQEFDRLMETSPMVKQYVIDEFNKVFKGKENSPERKFFDELRKPDVCNIIVSAERYKYGYGSQPLEITLSSDNNNEDNEKQRQIFISKEQELIEKERRIHRKEVEEMEKKREKRELQNKFHRTVVEMSNRVKDEMKKIDEFVDVFQNMYSRKPMVDEVTAHVKDLVEKGIVQEGTLAKYLAKYHDKDVASMV